MTPSEYGDAQGRTPDVANAPGAGWAYPANRAHAAHFFPAGEDRSLCKRWSGYVGERKVASLRQCTACERKLAALSATHAPTEGER